MKIHTDWGYTQTDPNNPTLSLGSRIKALRIQKGLYQEDIANQAKLPLSLVAKYEQNKIKRHSVSTIEKIALVFGISGAKLLNPTANTENVANIICPPVSFGTRIKNLRLKQNIYQKELARLIGVNRESIRRYENNLSKPNQRTVSKIFEILGT